MGRPFINEGLWIEAQRMVLDLKSRGARVDASELTELGLRMLLAVLRHGRVPDDLGFVLAERDPEALRQLQQLLAAAASQPTYEVA